MVLMPPDEHGQYVLDPRDVNPNYFRDQQRKKQIKRWLSYVLVAAIIVIGGGRYLGS